MGVLHNRVRLWRAMRQLRRFDLRQLQMATETPRSVVRLFASLLQRTGYVVKRGSAFVLVRDSGPKPPRFLTGGGPDYTLLAAIDRNTGDRHGLDGQPAPAPVPKVRRPEPKPRRQWHPRWRKRRGAGAAA